MARRRPRNPEPSLAVAGTLAPHSAQARVEELAKERARLLREVQKKQRQLEQAVQRVRDFSDHAVARMAPILERQRRLAEELAKLFTEILADPRVSVRARKQLEKLRRALELQGVLEPTFFDDEEAEEEAGREEGGAGGRAEPGRRRSTAEAPGRERTHPAEVAGAKQVGQQRRSLRDLFRSLARAIHPDQARQEDERARRTEVMKQVTRAYEEGDLARLLELEGAWQSAQAVATSAVDPDERCRELERSNRELLDQLRDVTRQLRDAKRELADAEHSYPPEEVVELAHRELDDVEGIGELLRSFRDGRISISDLMDGPLPRPRRRKRGHP